MTTLERKIFEHNLLVEENKTPGTYIIIYPTPGCVIKFKKARILFTQTDDLKCFINLAHCIEVPAPDLDAETENLQKLMKIDSSKYQLPMSLGSLDCVKDKRGENSLKFDVIINSDYYHKRFTKSEFHRQLIIAAFVNQIEEEHQVKIERSSQVVLQNKKVFGTIGTHMIPKTMRKEPKKPTVIDLMDIHRPFDLNPQKNVDIWVEQGIQIKIRILIPDLTVLSKDLRLEANDDHIILLLKGGKRIADFYLPVDMDVDDLKAKIVEAPKKKKIKGTIVEMTSKCVFPG